MANSSQIPLSQSKTKPFSLAGYYSNALPAQTTAHSFGDWKVTIQKAPILSSQCTCSALVSNECKNGDGHTVFATPNQPDSALTCAFCRMQPKLKLDHLPDMVFADNFLRIEHSKKKLGIDFNAIDAVNSIRETVSDNVQVASANVWQESRAETLRTYGSKTINYDWTYTPDYKGTIFGDGISVQPTSELLDIKMLSQKDPVRLFEDLQLYGDELDDNGCAEMNVKIRVVDLYVFILLRFYLRVDHVMVRLHDTRLLFEKGKSYMLREFSVRESKICNLPAGVSPMDPTHIFASLPPKQALVEQLQIHL